MLLYVTLIPQFTDYRILPSFNALVKRHRTFRTQIMRSPFIHP
ncbi:MAG: hypothetical protein V7K70_10805 [Nostoc sp.]